MTQKQQHSNQVSIRAEFSLPINDSSEINQHDQRQHGTIIHNFNTDTHPDITSKTRIGLPIGMVPVKPKDGDYTYSGMHDHGPLEPKPKEGGPFHILIGLVNEARSSSDELLTNVIEDEKKMRK